MSQNVVRQLPPAELTRGSLSEGQGEESSPTGNLLKGHPGSQQAFDFWRSLDPTAKIMLMWESAYSSQTESSE